MHDPRFKASLGGNNHIIGRRGTPIEVGYIELDPVLDGFSGVLVELCRTCDGLPELYVVRETAAATGNRVLVFASRHESLAREVFERELSGTETDFGDTRLRSRAC